MLKPLLVLALMLFFAPSPQQPPATPAPPSNNPIPPEAAHLVNPVKPTPESQALAKKMYGYDCAVCHGANGNGKGDLAADMKPPLRDYTDPAALKDISDGELFYVIKNGKGQMTGEGDRINSDGIWNMVILVRSFAKK
jgi:mono/diheme cytochrome c family protein